MATAMVFRENGVIERIDSEGREFSLDELQRAVGGYIESVPGADEWGLEAYCNEEGRVLRLKPNALASEIFMLSLVGPVVCITPEPVTEGEA